MTRLPKIPWPRVLGEGVMIVVSILLALWIQAWWEGRQEAQQGRNLAEALLSEVAKNEIMISGMIEESREWTALSRELLTVMASAGQEGVDVSRLRELGTVFSTWPWLPDNDVYEQALATGQLLLIDNSDLRFELARYYSALSYVGEVVEDIRMQYMRELEPFLVENTVYTDIAYPGWLEDLPVPPYSTDIEALAASRELWNLLALRLLYDRGLTDALEWAQQAGDVLKESLLVYSR